MNFQSSYEKLAGSKTYKNVDLRLKLISWSVITLSALATACVNGWSHRDVIGVPGAICLAILVFVIVEAALLTVEEGLRTTFKGGSQRLLAWLGKWLIKLTMISNAAYLCTMITGTTPPELLLFWNRWSFAVHFGIGLVLIPMIRDADPVIAARMLRLKAETAQEDQIINRMAAAVGSPFALIGARMRGFLDGLVLGFKLLGNREGFNRAEYVRNLNALANEHFKFAEGGEPPQIAPPAHQPAMPGPVFSAPAKTGQGRSNGLSTLP